MKALQLNNETSAGHKQKVVDLVLSGPLIGMGSFQPLLGLNYFLYSSYISNNVE